MVVGGDEVSKRVVTPDDTTSCTRFPPHPVGPHCSRREKLALRRRRLSGPAEPVQQFCPGAPSLGMAFELPSETK